MSKQNKHTKKTKNKLIDSRMVFSRGEGGWGEDAEAKEGKGSQIHGDGSRLVFGWWVHNKAYRCPIIKLYICYWYNVINQFYTNTFNKDKDKIKWNYFPNFIFGFLIAAVYKNTRDFCALILYPIVLLSLFVRSNSFFVDFEDSCDIRICHLEIRIVHFLLSNLEAFYFFFQSNRSH